MGYKNISGNQFLVTLTTTRTRFIIIIIIILYIFYFFFLFFYFFYWYCSSIETFIIFIIIKFSQYIVILREEGREDSPYNYNRLIGGGGAYIFLSLTGRRRKKFVKKKNFHVIILYRHTITDKNSLQGFWRSQRIQYKYT